MNRSRMKCNNSDGILSQLPKCFFNNEIQVKGNLDISIDYHVASNIHVADTLLLVKKGQIIFLINKSRLAYINVQIYIQLMYGYVTCKLYTIFFWQFVSWFCIISVTEAALGTSCNETADPSNCAATESCYNSKCVCSDGYFDVGGNCESSKFQYTITYQQLTSLQLAQFREWRWFVWFLRISLS